MRKFPDREADLMVLARQLIAGLVRQAAEFPSPPLSPAELQARLDSFCARSAEQQKAQAEAQKATDAKRAAGDFLIAGVRSVLRYAENACGRDDAKLTALGWRGRAAPKNLPPPGQPLGLRAVEQGDDWIALDWKAPTDGGKVAVYQVERRDASADGWMLVNVSFEPQIRLADQPRGVSWQYRVLACNKSGPSPPSNTITAVL